MLGRAKQLSLETYRCLDGISAPVANSNGSLHDGVRSVASAGATAPGRALAPAKSHVPAVSAPWIVASVLSSGPARAFSRLFDLAL